MKFIECSTNIDFLHSVVSGIVCSNYSFPIKCLVTSISTPFNDNRRVSVKSTGGKLQSNCNLSTDGRSLMVHIMSPSYSRTRRIKPRSYIFKYSPSKCHGTIVCVQLLSPTGSRNATSERNRTMFSGVEMFLRGFGYKDINSSPP